MTRLDSVIERYDLKTLEAALERRRRQEERKLARLMRKRKKLEAELKKIDREMKRAEQAAKANRRGAVARKPNARRLNDITLADALEKVFRSRKGPVHYKDLTETVTKRGLYRTRSKNLLSTVAVTLKRDRRFKKLKPGLYALVKR
jgi:hypothetical protein